MSFIDKIKIENTDYDIQDTEARKQIKALENTPSGSAIPEITEDINIFDLETGIYYVNPQIVLTYSNTGFSDEESLTVFVKSILIVQKTYFEEELGQIYYQIIGFNPETEDARMVGTYHGFIESIIGFYPVAWNGKKPKFMSMDSIEALTDKVTQITSNATDEQYPSAKAVYDYVNSAIGTALDGEY